MVVIIGNLATGHQTHTMPCFLYEISKYHCQVFEKNSNVAQFCLDIKVIHKIIGGLYSHLSGWFCVFAQKFWEGRGPMNDIFSFCECSCQETQTLTAIIKFIQAF